MEPGNGSTFQYAQHIFFEMIKALRAKRKKTLTAAEKKRDHRR